MQSCVSTVRLLLAIFFGASINFAAIADLVEDFYKGKQIRLIIGTQPGGTCGVEPRHPVANHEYVGFVGS